MRVRSILPLVLLSLLLLPLSATVQAQDALELPTYAPGDFWTYDLAVPQLLEALEELEDFDLEVEVTLTHTVQGTTEIQVDEDSRQVYEVDSVLTVVIEGSGVFDLFDDPADLTVSGRIYVNSTLYQDVEGLELLQADVEVSGLLFVTTEAEGFQQAFQVELSGTVNLTVAYTADTWVFPLEVDQEGQEAFAVTGTASFLVKIALLEDLETEAEVDETGVFQRRVDRQESVLVPAGTFDTWVVNTTTTPGDPTGPEAGWELAYWSGATGAPVKQEFYDPQGEQVASMNLTSYRYQAAELRILGLPPVVFGSILAVVIAAVAVLVFFFWGKRPPRAAPVAPEPGPPEVMAEPEPGPSPEPPSEEGEEPGSP